MVKQNPHIMCTRKEWNELIARAITKQHALACNSNFYIEGFNAYKVATMIEAFCLEAGLLMIVPDSPK